MYIQLIVDKNTKAIQWEKIFSTNGAIKLYIHMEEKKRSLYLTLYTRNNSKWTIHLHWKPKTIKLLKTIGEDHSDLRSKISFIQHQNHNS